MIKRGALWLVVGIMLVPAIASAGKLCSLERPASDTARLGDQAQEMKQDLSSYRYEGSLWAERRSDFYMDNKARRINDVVTIQIAEISNASQKVSTKTSRDTNILAGIVKFLGSPLSFGLDNFWGRDKPFAPEIESSAKSSHSGSGAISGSGKLTANIAAKVIDIPFLEGDIEGGKAVLVAAVSLVSGILLLTLGLLCAKQKPHKMS